MSFLKKRKKLLFGILAVIVVAAAIGSSYYFGYRSGMKTPQTLVIKGISGMDSDKADDADFSVFWQAWQKLKDTHIKGAELKNQDMLYGAIAGLVNSVGDPNTNFFKPDDSQKFEEDISGNFGGVGMEINIRDKQLIVVSPLEDSPAIKAGIRAGDKILEIDHKSAANLLDVNEAVKKIRGEIGTPVTLTILHNGDKKSVEITITRARIEVPTLKMDVKDDNIAHLRLFSFNENAPFLFYRSALTILLGKSKGIVLDLRNNPGGYLEIAVNVAGWFLDKGDIIVSEKFRDGDGRIFRASGSGALKNIPLVILMNKGSASASEILAGALKYHLKVKLIGEKSYGKGTVQEMQNLKDGSKIKITIAQWLLPNGKILDENGLTPDIEVKITEEDIEAKKDPQLDRAMEELKKIIDQKSQ